jgi:hypothetical protein
LPGWARTGAVIAIFSHLRSVRTGAVISIFALLRLPPEI